MRDERKSEKTNYNKTVKYSTNSDLLDSERDQLESL